MPDTPVNNRVWRLGATYHLPDDFKTEPVPDVASTEEMRTRVLKPSQHGNATTYTNFEKPSSSQSEGKMRCPHNVYNPQLPNKDPSCEEMFSEIETLKSHIREVHGFCLEESFDAPSQLESYESIWKKLFGEYRGPIPPASGLVPDDARRMQNLRMVEMMEGYIWNRLIGCENITRETLKEILNSFRSSSKSLIITEAMGFIGSTGPRGGPAPIDQRQRAHSPKPRPDNTIPCGQDLRTSFHENQIAVSKSESGGKSIDNAPILASIDTRDHNDKDKVAKIMEQYRELTQSCSDIRYEDDDESGEEQTAFDQPNLDEESTCISDNPGDVGEGSSKAMNGPHGNARAASAEGSTNTNTKLGHSRSSMGGNDDQDRGRKRRKQSSIRSKSIDRNAAKFACPYAKHAPDEPLKAASCCYPGFPSVSRVKEHIYRTHAALIQCPRCFQSFGNEDGLTAHLRDTARCTQVQEKPDTKTITLEQERKLRSKMKSDAPEELKWRQIYRIIFNLDDTSDTPSPYNNQSSSAFQLFSRYEKHCREALPSLVESEVERIMSHAPMEMGETLKSKLIQIVLKCQESLFTSFRVSESGTPRQPPDPDPLDGQYNYMDFPLINSEMWEFGLEGIDLGGGSFL